MTHPPLPQGKFGKQWLSDAAKSWIHRFLFPDFSNKLTWYVIATGCALILTPESFQFLMVEWVLNTFSLSVGKQLTIADFAANDADYWAGCGLVALALLHNLANRWIAISASATEGIEHQQREGSDLALYNELAKLLPSGSASIRMLIDHDFGNSFNTASLDALDDFVEEWNCPERSFHNAELEAARKSLWECARGFSALLGLKSCPTSVGLQSVVPDRHRQDFNWPDWVESDVKAVNEAATKTFHAHQAFMAIGKKLLKC